VRHLPASEPEGLLATKTKPTLTPTLARQPHQVLRAHAQPTQTHAVAHSDQVEVDHSEVVAPVPAHVAVAHKATDQKEQVEHAQPAPAADADPSNVAQTKPLPSPTD